MIDEIITGNDVSTETNPTGTQSEVVVEHSGKGRIHLQEKTTNGDWVYLTSKSGGYVVSTPDLTMTYRFIAKDVEDNARVYFI
jgi:hypothetical protein